MEEDSINQRQKLSDVPLWELVKAQKELGFKKTQQILLSKGEAGVKSESESTIHISQKRLMKNDHRLSQKIVIPTKFKTEAPLEISAKIRVRQPLANTLKVKKTIKIDPRFGERFGKFDEDKFNKAYGFIDELRQMELMAVQKKLKKTKNNEEKDKLRHFQKSAMNRIASQKDKASSKNVDKLIRNKEIEISTNSKTPFYFKNSVKKQFYHAHKFAQLKKQGKINKYLQKKRVKVGKIESRRPHDNVNI